MKNYLRVVVKKRLIQGENGIKDQLNGGAYTIKRPTQDDNKPHSPLNVVQ